MIKIHITRKIYPKLEEDYDQLYHNIVNTMFKAPGFISAESLVSIHDPTIRVTCMQWQNIDYWRNWKNSPQRQEISQKLEAILCAKEEICIYKYMK